MENGKNRSRAWLLVADGEPLSQAKMLQLAKNKSVMVLDGAYNYAKQAGLAIDVLLGDLDTISAEDLRQARSMTTVIEAADQTKTDLEKGLAYLMSLDAKEIFICGALGLRLQHTLFNLRLLKKFFQKDRLIVMFSETEIIQYYEDTEISLSGHQKDGVAILGFPYAVISSSGLEFDVQDCVLDFEKMSSISNTVVSQDVVIKCRGGILVIIETLVCPPVKL